MKGRELLRDVVAVVVVLFVPLLLLRGVAPNSAAAPAKTPPLPLGCSGLLLLLVGCEYEGDGGGWRGFAPKPPPRALSPMAKEAEAVLPTELVAVIRPPPLAPTPTAPPPPEVAVRALVGEKRCCCCC